jgi:two-component system chemotaxis response regulator CheB
MPIKVLIVDDSALIRQLLTEIINSYADMQVVGVAHDALMARERIKTLNPDVITLDIEMPKMDGLAFLEKLMQLRPTPVIMISSLTERNAGVTLRALELGAVDFITKPKLDISEGIQAYSELIAEKIRIAAKAKPKPRSAAPSTLNPRYSADAVLPSLLSKSASVTEKLIVIGASTGGTEAIREILECMPPDCPGIVIAQHMPETFTRAFAKRLDNACKIRVKEAEEGERVLAGHAYIAPGHSHLLVKRNGRNYVALLNQGPAVNRHRPSVDVLFRSAANCAGNNAIGIILTGMGSDGAAGMREMKQAGAYNLAQDESSCVVFGMPKMAIEAGAVDKVLPLGEMVSEVLTYLNSSNHTRAVAKPAR